MGLTFPDTPYGHGVDVEPTLPYERDVVVHRIATMIELLERSCSKTITLAQGAPSKMRKVVGFALDYLPHDDPAVAGIIPLMFSKAAVDRLELIDALEDLADALDVE